MSWAINRQVFPAAVGIEPPLGLFRVPHQADHLGFLPRNRLVQIEERFDQVRGQESAGPEIRYRLARKGRPGEIGPAYSLQIFFDDRRVSLPRPASIFRQISRRQASRIDGTRGDRTADTIGRSAARLRPTASAAANRVDGAPCRCSAARRRLRAAGPAGSRLASVPSPQACRNNSTSRRTGISSPGRGPKFQASHQRGSSDSQHPGGQRQIAGQRLQDVLPGPHAPGCAPAPAGRRPDGRPCRG